MKIINSCLTRDMVMKNDDMMMMVVVVVVVGERERGDRETKKEREEKKEGRERGRERAGREGEGEGEGEREGERERPHTLMLLRKRILKITIGCLCRGPSRRFQGACRFSTHKKLAQRLDSSVRDSRRVERDQKKRVHLSRSVTGGSRNGRFWRAGTPSICE